MIKIGFMNFVQNFSRNKVVRQRFSSDIDFFNWSTFFAEDAGGVAQRLRARGAVGVSFPPVLSSAARSCELTSDAYTSRRHPLVR